MIKPLEHLSYEERLRKLEQFNLAKKKRLKDSHEHVHNAYKYLMGRSKDIRTRDFLSVVHSDRTKGNGRKMKYRKYLLKFLLRKNVSMSGWSNQVAQRPWSMHRNNPCATYCS